ncbi:FGGY-family carbohydrate kinase [Sphingobacterium paludis]|uniref:Sugar (Pentulose or hexulose) kinase n=1 Tax=Sphingobacterium paludis TaxID=1476465 RepID=A0A4R7CSM6_9SPHI|nr:FGGY family carbohydrate kinase [Sphingobacterium paludis]TDS10262.1 sugar (pentulose or hexulose) kinase [Sphingobacterium paludis]
MGKTRIPVVAIFDVGKTNKKLFLFDERYQIVFERSARFLETEDEDGDACENLESLRLSVFDSLHEVFRRDEFDIKAINFTSYGASFVYLNESGRPLTPLYNYLKEYPKDLEKALHALYGGVGEFSLQTASPALGSLNSGLQVYRVQQEKPEIFEQVKFALHLPQYLSFLVSGQMYSDMTSIGCHTALWDFSKKAYHQWVSDTGIEDKLAPIVQGDEVFSAAFPGSTYKVGVGLHDSSSALIPYLLNFHEPFVLISTGTWCISLNPFNEEALTEEQLEKDCLFYMTYAGTPVKASRLFAGYEHESQTKRIAEHFQVTTAKFKNIEINWSLVEKLTTEKNTPTALDAFRNGDLSEFTDYVEAYHALIVYLVAAQVASTQLTLSNTKIKRIFVDGGFSKNNIFMNLLAKAFTDIEIYAASMAQATAIGAALVIHKEWNSQPIPTNIIELRYYRA